MSKEKSMVVIGSVAIDWVITPKAEREESIGGSATYFSMAAAYHTPVRLVGVVGRDFPDQPIADLKESGVDLNGLDVVSEGLTFRWKGRYHENMNNRDTLETHLNCFEHFSPSLPDAYRDSDFVFLANIQPELQSQVLDQMRHRPQLVGLDTMNLWIDIASDALKEVLRRVDVLIINEEEALQLTGETNLVRASRLIRAMGPQTLVIKRGEHGALLFGSEEQDIFAAPALPLETVSDPTGAGDCFAGGFMGYLASCGTVDAASLRRAVVWGSTMASYCVEGFSYDGLKGLREAELRARYQRFVRLTRFE